MSEKRHIDIERGHALGEVLMPTIVTNARESESPTLFWAASSWGSRHMIELMEEI